MSALPDNFGTIAPAALNDQVAAAQPCTLVDRESKAVTEHDLSPGPVMVHIRTQIKNHEHMPPPHYTKGQD